MPVFVVGIGNTSVRIDAPSASIARLRAQQYYPGLHQANPGQFGHTVRIAGDNDGGIQFISPNDGSIEKYRTQIVGASGLGTGYSRDRAPLGGSGGNGGGDGDSGLFDFESFEKDAQPVLPPSPGGALEQQAPFGAFTNFLGRFTGLGRNDPRSAARTFAESQYSPNLSAFQGRTLAEGLPEGVGQANAFQSFLNEGLGGFNPRQRIGDAFRSVQAAAPGADPQSDLGLALNAQKEEEFEQLFNLASNLQASRTSPLVSRAFQRSRGDNWENFNRFAAQRQAGGGQNALDYLRQQFGLGQLGF